MREITNSEDIIDSRDVEERITELDDQRSEFDPSGTCERAVLDEDEADELTALLKLREEAEGYSEDWKYGATLIRDSYFRAYAEELADEIGAINSDQTWPLNHIDWEAAADALKEDYTAVDFDGVEYWVR
jgi:hypothetical protein